MLVNPHPPSGYDQNIVIAHKVGRHAVIRSLVIVHERSPRIAAVQHNHFATLHLVADDFDKLAQVALLFDWQIAERFFHTHKVSKIPLRR